MHRTERVKLLKNGNFIKERVKDSATEKKVTLC